MRLSEILRGEGLFARVARSSAWAIFGYGTSQAIRLASNLILTRLLFPEAFGMMALVTVFMVGLAQFSDIGIGPAIMQNRRGDEPDFLNTAWTIQVVRSVGLWLGTWALAWPVASFYGEPMLAQLLPVAGVSLLIGGFNPTKLETANRHLALGRVIQLDLVSQIAGIAATVLLAWATGSIWALVLGVIIGTISRLLLAHLMLPGKSNRFLWERSAARELVHFGKWIFLSTACGFLIAQGDRLVLGKYLSLELLGIYNVGYFLASFPVYLGNAVAWRILIPLYRERPPAEAPENFRKIRLLRLLLTGFLLTILLGFAFFGRILVEVLYDPRYIAAGAILVVAGVTQIPLVIGMTYDQAALAAGDSRRFSLLLAVRGVVQTAFLLIGAETAGLIGALAGQGLALVLVYPLVVWLARRYGAWDPLHDLVYGLTGLGFGALALWLQWDAVAALAAMGRG